MTNKQKYSILTLILLILIFILGFIKNAISISNIEDIFEKNTGLKLQIEKSNLSFNSKLDLIFSANCINIYNKNKSIKFAVIKNPNITIKPFSLIVKKINIKDMTIEEIAMVLSRNEKGEIDLLKAINTKELEKFKNSDFAISRLVSKINNINLTFIDEYKIKSKTKLCLYNTNIDISKKHKVFRLSQKGKITTLINSKEQIAKLNIDINSKYPFKNSKDIGLNIGLNDVNLYIFNDLVKKYISKDILSFNGMLNLNIQSNKGNDFNKNLIISIKKPTIKLTDNKIIAPYQDIKINSLFNIENNTLEFSNFDILSEGLDVKSKGKIEKIFSKDLKPDINIVLNNTQLNKFLYFLPDNLIYYRPKGIPTLKKSNFFATLKGNMTVKSFTPIDITGNLKAENIYIPNYPKSFIQNDVNVIFMKDKMRVYTRVYTPQNEYVIVDGISNLDDSLYGKYSVKSTKNIDLAFAKLYLVPIQQIIGFNIGPVPIMEISGYGNIDIKTQGTIKDAQIFGNFEARNASAKIEGLDAKLINGNCKLIFNDRDLIFKEIKGKMDGANFLLVGKGNTKGEVDLNTNITNARMASILKIFNNSLISKPYLPLTKQIAATSGIMSAKINLKGRIDDYENKEFLNTLALSGNLNLNNNKIILKNGLGAKNITGMLNFGSNQAGFFELFINNSKFNLKFNSPTPIEKIAKDGIVQFNSNISSNKISFKDILNEAKNATFLNSSARKLISNLSEINFYSKMNINSNGSININNINFDNIKNNGYITGLNSEENKNILFNSGTIKIKENKLIFDNFDAVIAQGNIKIKGYIDNFVSKTPKGDLIVYLKDVNLNKLNQIIPKIKVTSSKLKSGKIILKNNDIKLNSLNIDYESMPVFINAQVKDIFNKKELSADFSTIANEITCDNIINPYLTYPVKISGEIPLKGSFKGNMNDYRIDFSAKIPRNSDLYFSGANLGDTNHDREIAGKVTVKQNIATIHNLRLIKYIKNQNSKINPITALKVNGEAISKDNDIFYNNLRISTSTPINVRILNLVFKKSLLKQGNFECDISLNGNYKEPKITGRAFLQDLDIPLYDTQINNIKVNISNRFIDANINAKNKESDLTLNVRALNKLEAPYIINNIDIVSQKIDIADLLDNLMIPSQKTDINKKQELLIKPDDIVIKDGSFNIKDVIYGKINAQNLKGNFNYNDNEFHLKNIILDIANGTIAAKGRYGMNSSKLALSANMIGCDANTLAKQFLNLENQIYGKMNGSAVLTAKNIKTPDNIKNVKSEVEFSINKGKMPKLGSLEYLLRAGNLFKNGLLGFSLNNLIEVLTPYKTGEFETIKGQLSVDNGEIKKLEIFSQGKNLSLYLDGNYNILENYANIDIYGKLSQNISNALGKVGNASINQLISGLTGNKDKKRSLETIEKQNKIPSIEIENPEPRYFRAKVMGDINKDNYIKSFNWDIQ